MTIYTRLIAACWIIFVVYWAAMALGAKKTIGARFWSREIGLRVGVLVLILLALRLPVFRQAMRNALTCSPAWAKASPSGPSPRPAAIRLAAAGLLRPQPSASHHGGRPGPGA